MADSPRLLVSPTVPPSVVSERGRVMADSPRLPVSPTVPPPTEIPTQGTSQEDSALRQDTSSSPLCSTGQYLASHPISILD